jgi:hypothetical protein
LLSWSWSGHLIHRAIFRIDCQSSRQPPQDQSKVVSTRLLEDTIGILR